MRSYIHTIIRSQHRYISSHPNPTQMSAQSDIQCVLLSAHHDDPLLVTRSANMLDTLTKSPVSLNNSTQDMFSLVLLWEANDSNTRSNNHWVHKLSLVDAIGSEQPINNPIRWCAELYVTIEDFDEQFQPTGVLARFEQEFQTKVHVM